VKPEWENYADGVERISVEGGWLYRTCSWVELPSLPSEPNKGYVHWSDPVFVPAAAEYARSKVGG
jgi:hypothetical protein